MGCGCGCKGAPGGCGSQSPAFGASPECARIEPAPSGQTVEDPCGLVCGPGDVNDWRMHARAYLDAAASSPLTPEQRSQLSQLEAAWSSRGVSVSPFDYTDAVNMFRAVATGAACLTWAALHQQPTPPVPMPVPAPVTPEAPEDSTWPSWPTLPTLPTWPGLGFPDIPPWVLVLAAVIALGVWTAPARAARARRRAA